MWNQKDAMDAGRFMLHQGGWDDKSALERYNQVRNSDFSVSRPYGGRGYTKPRFPGENGFNQGGFHRDMLLETDRYQMAPPMPGPWPPARQTTYKDKLGIIQGTQRYAKAGYGDSRRDADTFRDANFRKATDNYRDVNNFTEVDKFCEVEDFRELDNFRHHEFETGGRIFDTERHASGGDDVSHKCLAVKSSREGSWDKGYTHSRYDDEYDLDYGKEKRDRSQPKLQKRDTGKWRSKDKDESPERGRRRERSHSHEHCSRSRSSSLGYTRDKGEGSYEDTLYDSHNEKKHTTNEKHHREHHAVAPSATLVVKGLSQRIVEDDLYQALIDWGPLRHVRVIKERTTGTSRGFAFIDFPSVDAARKMMDEVGENGLVVDGRRLFFEYSSKPTGGGGVPQVDSATCGTTKGGTAGASAVDWICTVCGCMNFARRTSCFQCNEGRTDDAPPADVAMVTPKLGKKGSEAGPTHVLIVRGLDENVNEEILHYEFSKYAPIKDLRFVRDKFTHISKGFAFIHFHSVEDATKALESSNGTTIDKNGQPLRVAYAKSIHGPGSSSSSNMHASNSLAAAAIEAATFAQQYDAVGWAPKEYNPDQEKDGGAANGCLADPNAAPQAGFVWDEASGYYYDAVSGFYYDGHRGLYYDGNCGIWYSYNQETQQYEHYAGQEEEMETTNVIASSISDTANHQKANCKANASIKTKDGTTSRKAVICAAPSTIHIEQDAKLGIAKAVKVAAAAAQSTMKKDKAPKSKSFLPSSKTRISGVSAMWKEKQEGVLTVSSDQNLASAPNTSLVDDKSKSFPAKAFTVTTTVASVTAVMVPKKIQGVIHTKQTLNRGRPDEASFAADSQYNCAAKGSVLLTGGCEVMTMTKKLEGVIHSRDGSANTIQAVGQGAGNPFGGDHHPSESSLRARQLSSSSLLADVGSSTSVGATSSKAGSLAVVSYGGPVPGGRRRFMETPQSSYRDGAAERRNRHGGSF